jgi:hypothetical protein
VQYGTGQRPIYLAIVQMMAWHGSRIRDKTRHPFQQQTEESLFHFKNYAWRQLVSSLYSLCSCLCYYGTLLSHYCRVLTKLRLPTYIIQYYLHVITYYVLLVLICTGGERPVFAPIVITVIITHHESAPSTHCNSCGNSST